MSPMSAIALSDDTLECIAQWQKSMAALPNNSSQWLCCLAVGVSGHFAYQLESSTVSADGENQWPGMGKPGSPFFTRFQPRAQRNKNVQRRG